MEEFEGKCFIVTLYIVISKCNNNFSDLKIFIYIFFSCSIR